MHIVIMGCGRVGASLARALDAKGHTVAVIDVDVDAFRRLGPDFRGRTVKGVGFDRDVLVKAGIRSADGFAAVSSGDNSNVLAARTVRENFGLTNVVARIYDQGRAEVYEKLGIPSVATVRWAATQVMTRLLHDSLEPDWRDPTGQAGVLPLPFDNGWIGRPIADVEREVKARLVVIRRFGHALVPDEKTVLQDGDLAFWAVPVDQIAAVRERLTQAPKPAEGH